MAPPKAPRELTRAIPAAASLPAHPHDEGLMRGPAVDWKHAVLKACRRAQILYSQAAGVAQYTKGSGCCHAPDHSDGAGQSESRPC